MSLVQDTPVVELRHNNPYSLGYLFDFGNGEISLESTPLKFEKSINDRYYTVAEGETLWSIALEAYGDSKYYWIIGLANDLEFMAELLPGESLIIPDLSKFSVLNG